MPTDVLPDVTIPVVSAIWQYRGLAHGELERSITTSSERAITTTVNNIEHMESVTLPGAESSGVSFIAARGSRPPSPK